ncbi:MAG: phosphoadenylyl-sulfate reductase, partial [Phyllobacteriaceae bacterium]|nr:phosphoadenylyl-sulfate reductase [Phyllobacteriaceae bacterium]
MSAVELVAFDRRPKTLAAEAAEARAFALDAAHAGRDAGEVIERAIRDLFPGRLAVVSSFGAESAVLLDLVAEVSTAVPILFVDTGQLFAETLAHRDRLVERLGFTDVRSLGPDPARLAAEDADGWLWDRDPDACCALRKVAPLATAIGDFDAWISGRKRFQAGTRATIPTFEADGARIKVNPLAAWTPERLAARAVARDLPVHPLVEKGFPSIGCLPCTSRVAPGEDPRAGRWRGRSKTECGIHLGLAAGEET